MDDSPDISVLLSTYRRNHGHGDCPNLLKRALDSILSQSFSNFELIVIDDASFDGTEEVLKKYALSDPRIQLIRHEKNSGRPAIRYNEGIACARGEYIAFMFDDDEWTPNALADLYAALISLPKHGMVFGLVKHPRANEEHFGEKTTLPLLALRNTIANHSVLIRKSVFEIAGGWDESKALCRICDWDLWLRIAKRFPIKMVKKNVGTLHEGLPYSLLNTVSLNHLQANLAMLNPWRKLPFGRKVTLRSALLNLALSSFIFLRWELHTLHFFLARIKEMVYTLFPYGKRDSPTA